MYGRRCSLREIPNTNGCARVSVLSQFLRSQSRPSRLRMQVALQIVFDLVFPSSALKPVSHEQAELTISSDYEISESQLRMPGWFVLFSFQIRVEDMARPHHSSLSKANPCSLRYRVPRLPSGNRETPSLLLVRRPQKRSQQRRIRPLKREP